MSYLPNILKDNNEFGCKSTSLISFSLENRGVTTNIEN